MNKWSGNSGWEGRNSRVNSRDHERSRDFSGGFGGGNREHSHGRECSCDSGGGFSGKTAKVTASKMAIVTVVSSLREATLVIGLTRVVLSMEVAGVTAVVAKTVANMMTCGVMTCGITPRKSHATINCAPLAKAAVTPSGLTRAVIGSAGVIGMARLNQGRTQFCPHLRNQQE